MGPSRGVDAVERAMRVLGCFEVAGETLALAQLAQRSCLYKSTILRLAISLQRNGFLKRDARGRYSLGDEIRHLGELARIGEELERAVRPELRQLTEATGEAASFYVRKGRHRMLLFREVSAGSVRHHLLEGGRHALIVGATGRLFRAFSSTARGTELQQIRARGWVASRGERNSNLGAVAVPIVNAERELVGVVNLAIPLSRFTKAKEQRSRALLLESRRRLQSALRHLDPAAMVHPAGEGRTERPLPEFHQRRRSRGLSKYPASKEFAL
jgi:DNA-binding IclR family transcriptional regulator